MKPAVIPTLLLTMMTAAAVAEEPQNKEPHKKVEMKRLPKPLDFIECDLAQLKGNDESRPFELMSVRYDPKFRTANDPGAIVMTFRANGDTDTRAIYSHFQEFKHVRFWEFADGLKWLRGRSTTLLPEPRLDNFTARYSSTQVEEGEGFRFVLFASDHLIAELRQYNVTKMTFHRSK